MRFANGYAALPRCTPSRAALLTGKSPAQLHMTFVGEGKRDTVETIATRMIPPTCVLELPDAEITIASVLKKSGYATAHFGKWHLGRTSPSKHGFDESDGATNNGGPENVNSPNPKEAFGMADRGMAFMAKQVAAKKAFYVQLSQYAARGPDGARKETLDFYMKRAGVTDASPASLKRLQVIEAAVIEDMDTTIGMLLNKLDDLGIANNTYVIYTSDHGAQGRNANTPLLSGKGNVFEGGIRVPFLIKGPGVKASVCSHTPVIGFDLFPTIAELAHSSVQMPTGVEGGSLVPLFASGTGEVKRSRSELYFHFPHYDHDNEGPASAVIAGNMKLIKVYETGASRLYDLAKDINEAHDLAKDQPQKISELEGKLDAYLKSINAQMPTPNPNYDPAKLPDTVKKNKVKAD